MEVSTYSEFVQLVEKYKILPFSGFVPEYPSLSTAAVNDQWHTDTDADPWQWRVKIVKDGVAAYGKFFGDKPCFIHKDLFPIVKTVLSLNKTVEDRFNDGELSRTALQIFTIIIEQGNIDSRELRKKSGLNAKEDKKEYEKALVDLQNYGYVVITGAAKQGEDDSGWSSMCYEPADIWFTSVNGSKEHVSIEDAKRLILVELSQTCTDKSLKYFTKKLKLN
ncbi:hypothetical protein I6N90_00385 [Paenibacillus sp. GSMTC-2017]|uniref:AlkZ-related protein n=1 Tax=Paenibacillus sp. GSMTC-2017 TaxID=2794350 RepID=UPI0018D8EC2D|nr:hypothetical protein [Paenibacillus sp. GSMTC-2017]MBH5316264.1 hypothetical protein [Paenibacillus sp. GSMTC-2017]